MPNEKILVIDDEKEINKLIQSYLLKKQYIPLFAFDGKTAIEQVQQNDPDLIILDITLPDIDGIDLCLEIRKITNCPILFLSCKSEEIDKIVALSVGGDDYVTKPFLPGELLARVKAHLRRRHLSVVPEEESIIKYAALSIDLTSREVFVDNQPVNLTAKEFEIFSILIKNPKRVFSMEQLFQRVWKTESLEGDSRTIMVYISNLRKKLENNSKNEKYIINLRGVGYKFNSSLRRI